MAQRKRRNEQSNGVNNGSWGYSEQSLKALESGQYGKTTGRQAKYKTSQDQLKQSQNFPALDGLLTSANKEIWDSNYGKNKKQYVDTGRARRNYENRVGHFANDARNLRNNGYESSFTDIDFSKVSDFDKELLDAALTRWDTEQQLNDNIRNYASGSAGQKVNQWLKNINSPSDEDRIAEAQSYIDKYGKSKDEVLKAYQIYKESEERRKREESPYLTGFKDFKSAPDRGLANFVKRASNKYFTGSDLEGLGDTLQRIAGTEEVEKQRNYSRNSNKISGVKKAFLDPYYQYGDLASTELAGALLGGGMAMADPAVGFGMSIEPTAGLGTAFKMGTGYGLTAEDKYNELIKQGVDPQKAADMANMSGISMAAAMAANKLIPSLEGASLPTKMLTKGGIGGTVMAAREAADQIADILTLGDQSAYKGKVNNYMAQGKSEAEAHNAARNDLLASDAGAYLFGLLTGAGSELVGNRMSKALSKGVDEVDDTLNSVWATQPALEDKGVPRLTGTVDNPQALPGSGNLPALVDNIYPIQMPGTNGVINLPGETAPIMLPDLAAKSAPVANKVMNESAGWTNPRLIKKLEGAELAQAQEQIKGNSGRIEALQTEIATMKKDPKNMYRGNLKKAVQKEIYNREKEIRELQSTNKGLQQQVKGGLKPVLDMLTKEQKNLIYDTSGKHDSVFSQINFAAKFAGDTPEARALATRAQNAIRQYVKTGSRESLNDMTTALTELDNMAKSVNATWKSSKGNEWNYEKAFGDQAQYLYNLQPVADIYNAERAAARAAQSASMETSAGPQNQLPTIRPNNNGGYTVESDSYSYDVATLEQAQNIADDIIETEAETSAPTNALTNAQNTFAKRNNELIGRYKNTAYDRSTYENQPMTINSIADSKFNQIQYSSDLTRGNVVAAVKRNIQEYNKQRGINSNNQLDNDTIGEIIIPSDGIRHGIAKLKDNVATKIQLEALSNLPLYTRNAVLVNEADGRTPNTDAYVLVGMYNNGDKNVAVRMLVNEVSKELENINVLYAIRAKKEGVREQVTSPNVSASTPSINNVTDFLDVVKDYFPNEISGKVADYYGIQQGKSDIEGLRYTNYRDDSSNGGGGNIPPTNTPPSNPNFSLVGDSYVPQEVPNVQPTPPTNNVPPTQEVPNMGGGNMKTSQYYKNTMRGTETNRDMSDKEYANRFDEEIFKRMTIPEQQSVSMGQRFIDESGSEEAAIQRLLSGDFDSEERFSGYHIDAAEMLANNIERQALELEAQGQDASQLWRTANKLHKKIQLNASDFGVGLQALQKWKKSTPQGAFDDLISQVNKGIDQKKTTGYTRNVNSLSDKIVDAVENSDSKASLIDKIKSIFAEDRKNNPYNTQKAEQQVLDLVGGDKNTKMSITDLADEAGKVIKKQMGVSSLTPKEERAILNLLDAASQLEPGTRAYNELVSQAMIIVDESLPASAGEKFKSLLYDNMLASIKTMFTRNFGGNVVGNAIDAMAAPFQVGADAIVGKFTGERTRTLNGKSIVAAAKGLGHGFKDWGQDIGYSLKNKTAFNTARSGQESLAEVLNAVHKTWKTQSNNKAVKAINNALSAYDYIIRKGMEGGDRPIYEAQYAATKAELYDVVDKYGDAGIRKGLPENSRDIDTDDLIEAMAINEALEAVLQNDSKMKDAAKHLKAFFKKSSEDMFGVDVASMSHAPFVEVPANMASNFFKLTPIGWAGNIARTIGEKKKYGSINQRRFTGELGLNVLGGLMTAGGIAAAGKYISDKYSDKKEEKKIQQNNGYQEYALQTPNESTQVDISDIPYLGPMMKFAKMERDAIDENGVWGGLKALPGAAGAATVDTLYQSLNRLTGADFQSGDGNLLNNAWQNVKSSVGSMGVPSIIRQTAQFTDPYKRDLGDYGTDEYNKNLIINGIPGLRQAMLEPKIDTAGQKVPELGGATGINRFLSAYVSPWKVSHPHANTSAVQEYANMLKQATEGKVNPQMKVLNKKDLTDIKGYDAENYSHADLRKLQEDYYQSNTELGNALINDPWFTNLSYEKQGELLDDLWTANKALVKEKFITQGMTPEQIEAAGEDIFKTDNKLAQILRDDDENHTGLLKWLKDETGRDEMNAKYGTEMSHDNYVKYNEREEGYADQRASETEMAKALGMSVDSYEKYEAEYPGGAQAYHDDKEAAKQYGFVKSDKSVNLDAYNIAKELGNGDPTVMQAYSDYKQEGIKSNAYASKASYLADEDRLTDEQKGMIIAGSQDGTKISKLAKGAQGAYDIGGYAGVNYYYLLKNLADVDGSGTVSKDERKNFFAGESQELDNLWQLNQEMYNYLMNNLK